MNDIDKYKRAGKSLSEKLPLLEHTKDQEFLKQAYEVEEDWYLRCGIVKRITDQDWLKEHFISEHKLNAKSAMLKNINDENWCKEMYDRLSYPEFGNIRARLVININDQAWLKDKYEHEDNHDAKYNIIENITDTEFLRSVFDDEEDAIIKCLIRSQIEILA